MVLSLCVAALGYSLNGKKSVGGEGATKVNMQKDVGVGKHRLAWIY